MTTLADPRLELDRRWCRLSRGEAASVRDSFDSAPLPKTAAAELLRGLALLDSGDPAAAAEVLRPLHAAKPENLVLRWNLALAFLRIGNHQEAHELLKDAVLFPQHDILRRALETLWPLRRTGDFAVLTFGRQSATPHSTDFARYEKCRAQATAGQCRRLGNRLLHAGRVAFERDEFSTATTLFQRAATILPTDPEALTSAVHLLLLHCQPAAARELLAPTVDGGLEKWATGRNPRDLPDVLTVTAWAWMLHTEGNHRDALAWLSLVEPQGPEDYGSHFVAAVCWMELGEHDKFRQALQFALGPFFLDTWLSFLRPMLLQGIAHVERMKDEG